MKSEEAPTKSSEKASASSVILSEGAGLALGSVFSRVIKPRSGGDRSEKASGKRPRSTVVFAESEEVRESLVEKKEERRKFKEARKANLQFESNARVVPDAATDAALEKELLATATKGAVALFNAVAKAQKIAEDGGTADGKKGKPVSRKAFMDMMKAGVNKNAMVAESEKAEQDSEEDEDTEKKVIASGAKWLQDDFLTGGAKKLKDWDKKASDEAVSESSEEEGVDDEDDSDDDSSDNDITSEAQDSD